MSFHIPKKDFIQPVVERANPGTQNTYHQYEWLSDYVGQYDIELSDLVSNAMILAFGGKVDAVNHPLPFINDTQERIEDVNRFFEDGTNIYDRLLISKKYEVSFLLISRYQVLSWQEMKQSFLPFGRVVFENEEFVLISLSDESHIDDGSIGTTKS